MNQIFSVSTERDDVLFHKDSVSTEEVGEGD